MVKSAVRVVLRVRPAAGVNPQAQYSGDNKGVTLTVPKTQDVTGTLQLDKGQSYQFKFDGVLRDVGQDEVYEACATDVLQSALQGFNGTIMCYGQTGAGKTFTMSGGRSSFKQRGIIPRMITHLFAEMRTLSDRSFKVSIQYLEIYNESLYDLLDITTQPHELNIFESARGSVSVSGLRSQVVHSEAEAMGLLFEGETNRVIGEHQLNRESSRSHSIFTIMLEMKMPGDAGEIVTSKVNLVDLAGSERVSKTKSEGLVLREACHINKSLSILEQVSLALSSKGRDHVPFRSSKLTHVLKDSLGGNCKTVLIANMWGEASQMDETLSTCRFAQRMMCITCEVSANVVEDQSVKARQLQRQIQELQQELAMHDAMAGRKDVAYAPYNDTQRGELTAMVQAFLTSPGPSDSIEPLDLISVRHMREILYCCRELYARRGGGASSGGAAAGASQPPPALAATYGRPASSSSSTAAAGTPTARLAASASGRAIAVDKDWSEYVGDEDSAGGAGQAGGVGVAPEGARPQDPGAGGASVVARLLALQQQDAPPPQPGRAGTGASAGPSSTARGGATVGAPPMDRHEALEVFKAGPGSSKASLLEENRSRLKGVKRRAKELGLSINTIKRDLDSLKARADELKAQRQAQQGDGAQVLDAEEYDTLMRVKELKQQYRDQFAELQMVRSEVEYTQQLCDTCAQELALEFNEWYSAAHGGPPAGTLDLNGVYPDEDPETSGNGPGSPSAKSMASFYAPSVVSTASKATSSKSGVSGRTDIVPGGGGTAQAGARTGGGTGAGPTQARAAAPAAKGTPAVSKPQARKVLSSLVTPPEDAGDPEAQAYYNAQTHLIQHTNGHRPGSVKKARVPAAFGATQGTRH